MFPTILPQVTGVSQSVLFPFTAFGGPSLFPVGVPPVPVAPPENSVGGVDLGVLMASVLQLISENVMPPASEVQTAPEPEEIQMAVIAPKVDKAVRANKGHFGKTMGYEDFAEYFKDELMALGLWEDREDAMAFFEDVKEALSTDPRNKGGNLYPQHVSAIHYVSQETGKSIQQIFEEIRQENRGTTQALREARNHIFEFYPMK